jgi:hypothetical protein
VFWIYKKLHSNNRMPKPVLNWTDAKGGRAIAIVKGGDHDKELLYLHEDDSKGGAKPKAKEIRAMDYDRELNGFDSRERTPLLNRLNEYRGAGKHPDEITEPPKVKDLYRKIVEDDAKAKSIELDGDAMFQPIPSADEDKREVWYIAGASGSGKSYFARGLAEAYKKLYPDREIYLISKLNDDETLDKMKVGKPKRINVNTLISHPPELDEFKDCMVLFDDYDTFSPPYDKIVMRLIDDLATMGRHTRTTMCLMTHRLTNYSKTRLVLNEATHIVVYPLATSFHPLKYLLKQYVGLDEKEVRAIKSSGSRWVCFHKNFPQYQITEHSAKLLNQ